MQETKITGSRIKNHFAYSWWKYAVLALLAVVGWNLIYTSTAYRAPKDKRLDIFFVTYSLPQEVTEWFREQTLENYPEVEDANVSSIMYTPEDTYYGTIQMTTYMGAGEGDIYFLPKERFAAFAPDGMFVPLDDAIASGAIDLKGIDVSRAVYSIEGEPPVVCGIPTETLYGLYEFGIDASDLVVGVTAYSLNQERAINWINWLIEEMQAPKPQWLIDAETAKPTQDVSDLPSF